MSIIEEFAELIKKEVDIIPFLKKLDTKQKNELSPEIKKLHKYYNEYIKSDDFSTFSSVSSRATPTQHKLFSIAIFICSNQKEFEQTYWYNVLNRETLYSILPWYCPSWFNAYIDKLAKDFIPPSLDYDWYLELVEQGYLQENSQMVAKLLTDIIFTHDSKERTYGYNTSILLRRAVTINKHIWYLFDVETNLCYVSRYKRFAEDTHAEPWMAVFRDFAKEGKLDRERLLKESIKAVNKNFNQNATNWFMDLFMFLEPTKDEFLLLQDDLLNTFSLNNTKPYTIALKIFKDLALEPTFNTISFFDNVILILTGSSKTAISSAIVVLDKIAKKYVDQRAQICVVASQAFIHQDNNLQIKIAKLIQKYGENKDIAVKEAVETYYDSLFLEAKNLLVDFQQSDFAGKTIIENSLTTATTTLNEINLPETFDDFVYLASQSFDVNETYHFDLLPASILKFRKEMTAENIIKLLPAFQRAYKLKTSDWNSRLGYLDNMLATYFITYGSLLTVFYPNAAKPLREMRQAFIKQEEEKKEKWASYQIKPLGNIKNWWVFTKTPGYEPHKQILLHSFHLLENRINLPLLSTPTHKPCFISITALIERFSRYQNAETLPNTMDLQIAVARCNILNKEEAIKFADTLLTGEYRELVGFILGENHFPKDSYKLGSAWFVAALNKSYPQIDPRYRFFSNLTDPYLTGQFEWNAIIEQYKTKKYDYKASKYVEEPAERKKIKINFVERQIKLSKFQTFINKITQNKKEYDTTVYDCLVLEYNYLSAEHNDIKRLLYLMPKQPEILIAYIIDKGIPDADYGGENNKKLITYTLETLLTLNIGYGPMSNLLIALSMQSSDKTVRYYAAEIWLKGVTENKIDSSKIGEIIGKQKMIEFAPLKRFTDLIISNMFQVSQKHNLALENLLASCLINMSNNPTNGGKKLLEIYMEVLAINKHTLQNESVTERLNAWQTNESLGKVIQKIKNL